MHWWQGLIAGAVFVLLDMWRAWSTRLCAQRNTIDCPDGMKFDVLVHRDRVPIYTTVPRWSVPSIGMFATLWAFVIRRMNNPWAVSVRQAPYPGQMDLLHEVYASEAVARQRASELIQALRAGHRSWDRSLE